MKITVTREIKNLRGVTFQTGGVPCPQCGNISGKSEDMTLRHAAVQALTVFGPDDKDGKDKFDRYRLALKITDNDELDLKPEELTQVRELIGRIYGVVVVGRCWEMLE